MINKTTLRVVGNILIYFVAIGLFGSAMAKLMGEKNIVEALSGINFNNPLFVGVVEMTCALLLAFPPTRRIGVLMCTAFIGGIIVAEEIIYKTPHFGILLVTFLWVGTFLREPDFFGIKQKSAA